MIEKMKLVRIVTLASRKNEMLDNLRNLGLVHVAEKQSADKKISERFSLLSKTAMLLKDYTDKTSVPENSILSDEDFEKVFADINSKIEEKSRYNALRAAAVTEADKIRAWGDFSPEAVSELKKDGIDLHFYRMDKKTFAGLASNEDVRYIRLASVDKMDTIAVIGTLPADIPGTEFDLPAKGLSQLEKEIADCDLGIKDCDAFLKDSAKYLPSFSQQMLKAQNDEEFSSMSNTAGADESLVWLSGYLPEDGCEEFRKAASESGWAYAIDDVADDDENVPTKVKYSKISRLMTPVFDILGTVPGYHEYDISFWFLCFFALFFAMIIGDAGYGMLFLICHNI